MKSSIQRLNDHNRASKLRAAAYCRVSTDPEKQEGSFETQMRYYREKNRAVSRHGTGRHLRQQGQERPQGR